MSTYIVQDDDGRFWVEEPGEFDPPDRWGPFATEERAREAAIQAMQDDADADDAEDDDDAQARDADH